MSNGAIPNPLAAPLTAIKQLGEQTSMAIQSLGTGLTRTASQGLDALVLGAPPLPGMPGVPAAGAGAGLPTPASLLPANLSQALGQIENVLIPPGLPRASAALGGAATPGRTDVAPSPGITPAPAAQQAVSGRRKITQMRGY